jgi:glycosyltransferase involved in cell wall biosynthesis
MLDVIENINYSEFTVSVAYKPEYDAFDNDLVQTLRKKNIPLVPLRGKRLFSFRGILDFYRHLKRNRTNIVHCWDALAIVARILRPLIGCRIIESFCNPVISKGSLCFYWFNKLTSLLTNGIIFCTEAVQKSFRHNRVFFMEKAKIEVINNCISLTRKKNHDSNIKEMKQRYGMEEGEVIITNIGFFNEQKGQVYLIEAMKNIIPKIPNAKLILVGWGPLENDLRAKVSELALWNNVLFAGKCGRIEIFEILSITDLFVLSSLWEGFGRVLGEAMAMGKPVVSTRTDGSEFVVKDNETGILVPPMNPNALADAVVELLNDPTRMGNMGELGKKRVNDLFSPQNFIQGHEALYRAVLE